MPRSVDPTSLSTGGGRAPQGSVEDSSLRNPDRDTNPLKAHIDDPSNVHEADAIHLRDSANNFSSDEVEGALAEVATGASGSRGNGMLEGGTWTDDGALTLTLDSPTTVLLNGMARDFSGASVLLPGTEPLVYVYIDSSTKLLTASTTVPPYAADHVPIAQVTTNGTISLPRDTRFFVKDLDRKLKYIVRNNGVSGIKQGEANFDTLDAAMWWLENYAAPSEKHTVIVRGDETLSSTTIVPADNITFEGEGEVVLSTGATLAPMFALNAKRNITFRNLTFRADHASSKAITDGGAEASGLRVEHCAFISGGSDWVTAIELSRTAAAQEDVIVRDTSARASSIGFVVFRPQQVRVIDCEVVDSSGTSGAIGISVGDVSQATVLSEGRSIVRGCQVTGFSVGIWARGVSHSVTDCRVEGGVGGLYIEGLQHNVSGVFVDLDSTVGTTGIEVNGNNHVLRGCTIFNQRAPATFTGRPYGIQVKAGSVRTRISGFHIEGFQADSFNGTGIALETGCTETVISDGVIDTPDTGIDVQTGADNCVITGVRMTDLDDQGILAYGTECVINGCQADLISTGNGLYGIDVNANGVQIADCVLINNKGTYPGSEIPEAIRIQGSLQRIIVSNCLLQSWYNSSGDEGRGIEIAPSSVDISIRGCTISSTRTGVNVGGSTQRIKIEGLNIKDAESGFYLDGAKIDVRGCTVLLHTARGLHGLRADSSSSRVKVVDCDFQNPRSGWAGETTDVVGISFAGVDSQAHGNTLEGFNNTNTSSGDGIVFRADKCTATGNIVEDCVRGIHAEDVSDFEISDNKILGNEVTGTAILIEGDTATSRSRNFTVTGNTLSQFTANGILVSGYAQNGVIADNSVDGYLPTDDYNPTGDGIVLTRGIGTNEISFVKVANNVIWRCKNGILAVGNAITAQLENISILGNTVHHCGFAENSLAAAYVEDFSFGSKGIGAKWVNGLEVCGNEIFAIGKLVNDSDITGDPTNGGAEDYVTARGVTLYGCSRALVRGNTIRELYNVVTATTGTPDDTNYGIAGLFLNNGVAFRLFESIAIEGNNINGGPGTIDKGIAISMNKGTVDPSGSHRLRTLTVSNNTIEDIDEAAIATAIETDQQLRGAAYRGNNCATLNGGTSLEAFLDFTLFDIGGVAIMSDILVSGNLIKWGASGTGVTGVRFSIPATSTSTFTDISIKDNTLDATADTGGIVTDSKGITFGSVGTPTNDWEQIHISGNTLRRCDNYGIRIGGTAGALNTVVSGNSLLDFEDLGIEVDLDGTVEHLLVSGNSLRAEGATSTSGKGILVTLPTSNTEDIEDIVVSDNVLSQIGGSGLEVNSASSGAGPFCQNIRICNNTFGNVGGGTDTFVLRSLLEDSTDGLVVNGNTFRNCGFTGGSNATLLLMLPGSGSDYENIQVCDNILHDSQVSGIEVSFEDGATSAQVVECLTVSRNQVIDNVSGNGIEVNFGETSGTAITSTARQVSVEGNLVNNPASIGVLVQAEGMASTLRDLSLSRNQVWNSGSYGIRVEYPDADGGSFLSSRVCDNIVSSTAADNGISVTGTAVDIGGVGGANFTVRNLTISRNTVTSAQGHGIRFRFEPKDIDAVNAPCRNVLVSDNLVRNCGTTQSQYGDYGISLRIPGAVEDFSLLNNICSENTGIGFYIDIGRSGIDESGGAVIGYSAGTLASLVALGNIARDNNIGGTVSPEDVAADGDNWPVSTSGINAGNTHSATPGASAWTVGTYTGDTWQDIFGAAGGSFTGITTATDYKGYNHLA